jgi:hypothetical protein
LAREAEEFVGKEPWAGAGRRAVVRAQRIKRGIDETYEDKKYEGLPRLAARGIAEWLARADPKAAGTGNLRR